MSYLDIIEKYFTCEFTTLSRKGSPVTWPVSPRLLADGRLLLPTSIGLRQKAFNIRRNSRVGMLFSEPTGSGVAEPGAVLIQGDATAEDRIVTDVASCSGRPGISRHRPKSWTSAGCAVSAEAAVWLNKFDEAVLTVVDSDGYPASLLCHSHDEKLWSLQMIELRGHVEKHQEVWTFVVDDFQSPSKKLAFLSFIGGVGSPERNTLKDADSSAHR
jgi:hypothetical protein